jgi:hypothetical protein
MKSGTELTRDTELISVKPGYLGSWVFTSECYASWGDQSDAGL